MNSWWQFEAVSLDFKRAFDMVDNNVLLVKLSLLVQLVASSGCLICDYIALQRDIKSVKTFKNTSIM